MVLQRLNHGIKGSQGSISPHAAGEMYALGKARSGKCNKQSQVNIKYKCKMHFFIFITSFTSKSGRFHSMDWDWSEVI